MGAAQKEATRSDGDNGPHGTATAVVGALTGVAKLRQHLTARATGLRRAPERFVAAG
jgi:hypothetical protein